MAEAAAVSARLCELCSKAQAFSGAKLCPDCMEALVRYQEAEQRYKADKKKQDNERQAAEEIMNEEVRIHLCRSDE